MRALKFLVTGICLTTLLSLQTTPANAANILGLFSSPSVSHLVVHIEMAKLLLARGHNVTIVTAYEPKVDYSGIHVIVIPPKPEQDHLLQTNIKTMSQKKSGLLNMLKHFLGTFTNFIDMQADVLKDARFTKLYESADTKFDLVILGLFMNSYQLGVAAKFKAPIVVNWLSSTMTVTNNFVGNPMESSYVPGLTDVVVKAGEKMTFMQRAQNLFINLMFEGIMGILDIRMKHHYSQLFPMDSSFPSLKDMYKNVSLVFCNSHFSEGSVRPNVPALVEIGGLQLKEEADPLPEDLANFLSTANNTGAILFSLGSNFKGSSLQAEAVTQIFRVLSQLEQKVIWKWEDSNKTPGNSSNILYRKWLPQTDILAHPNLKLFITHAGRGGITEAQYYGVPMLAIPLFGDQHDNAKKIVKSGYGQLIDILTFSEETFGKALHEMLNNPQYSENVQKFAWTYRDRPLSARESFIYWTEYVIRYHGAAHMQSPRVHMNFIEINNLDVFAFLILVTFFIYYAIKISLKFICRRCWKSSESAKKKLKKSIKKTKKH